MTDRRRHNGSKVGKLADSSYFKVFTQLAMVLLIGLGAWFVRNIDVGLAQINQNVTNIARAGIQIKHNAAGIAENRKLIMLDLNKSGPFTYGGNK